MVPWCIYLWFLQWYALWNVYPCCGIYWFFMMEFQKWLVTFQHLWSVLWPYDNKQRVPLSLIYEFRKRFSENNPLRVVLGPPSDLWFFLTTCYLWLNLFDLNSMHPPEKERLLIFISPLPHTWERDSSGFKALTSRGSKTAQLFRSRSKLFYIRIIFPLHKTVLLWVVKKIYFMINFPAFLC